ncbi:MAG: ABC transporter permease [Kiritimatiellaeota bacterium]|nr:ABC transporter permease [Kiritimatiellota bacterium]
MTFWMIAKVAWKALMRNKVRSVLTALGIIVGIAAVIAVVSIGNGASSNMKEQINTMGDNLVMVFPGSLSAGGVRMGGGAAQTLTAGDGEAMVRDYPHLIKAWTPMLRAGGQAMYMQNNWAPQTINGVSPAFTIVRKWDVSEGAFFTESDMRTRAKVCVIGHTLVEKLFDGVSPIGENIRIRNMPFRVIGVLQKKGTNSMGQDQDDIVILPLTTVRNTLARGWGADSVNQILFSLYDMGQLDEAKKQLAALLRQRHRLGPDVEDDFSVLDMTEITAAATSISSMMTILMIVVASISLIVGGIGIMNIMLVSVTERTKEIGLRMAIGATPNAILAQFLTESAMLSMMGGIVGVALGIFGANMVGTVQGWPIEITTSSVIISFAFSAGVGVFFGFYPALRASRLNPIDCLRYE